MHVRLSQPYRIVSVSLPCLALPCFAFGRLKKMKERFVVVPSQRLNRPTLSCCPSLLLLSSFFSSSPTTLLLFRRFSAAAPSFAYIYNSKDAYPPAQDDTMEAPTRGNGNDFNPDAPYRMYHGDTIPGT